VDMSSGIRGVIETQAQVLGPVLHAGMAVSLTASSGRRKGLAHEKYPHVFPGLLRCELREYLEREGVPAGWKITGDSRKMAQLKLEQPEHGLELRFLKERRRTYPGGVPVAGANRARRDMWMNQELDLKIPQDASRVAPTSLLLLWDFVGSDLDRFTLRIVHTLEAGVYGKLVPCDLILEVKDGGTIFSRLSFVGDPEDEDLYGNAVEIDEEAGGLDI